MHSNKPGSHLNNLSGHASLLLSASPTIINSPLQNNTNNISDDELPEDNINFKQPQNEIFKKLDGKIRKIVAAHSNLNKLYALNDFPGIGTKKPLDLPPQLPRPPPWVPKVSPDIKCNNQLTEEEEKRKFQMELINMFRQEIAAVTKLAKLKFSPQPSSKVVDQKSLLIKKSPQSIFNTIRRETSLLLNRRDSPLAAASNRPGSSLLVEQKTFQQQQQQQLHPRFEQKQSQPHFRNRPSWKENSAVNQRQPFNRFQMVKVIVPPTDYLESSNSKPVELDSWCPSREFTLDYRQIQAKLGRARAYIDLSQAPQKSLDKIIHKLQAKRYLSSASNSSPSLNNSKRTQTGSLKYSPPSSAKPIPVFRTTLTKSVNLKSKKSKKRLHEFGLKLGNYMEREVPQPATEKLTVEQFAKCLDLVRSNDASLQRHQEKLMQPIGDRPRRLRRLRVERPNLVAI